LKRRLDDDAGVSHERERRTKTPPTRYGALDCRRNEVCASMLRLGCRDVRRLDLKKWMERELELYYE
jgi:hypothetical protein